MVDKIITCIGRFPTLEGGSTRSVIDIKVGTADIMTGLVVKMKRTNKIQ